MGFKIDLALATVVAQGFHHLGGDSLAGVRPGVQYLVVPLLVGDDAALIEAVLLGDFLLGLGDDRVLGRGRLQVVGRKRQPRAGRFAEAEVFHPVQKRDRLAAAQNLVAVGDDALKLLLAERQVIEGHPGVQDVVEDDATDRRLDDHAGLEFLFTVAAQPLVGGQAEVDHGMHADLALTVGQEHFVGRGKRSSLRRARWGG